LILILGQINESTYTEYKSNPALYTNSTEFMSLKAKDVLHFIYHQLISKSKTVIGERDSSTEEII